MYKQPVSSSLYGLLFVPDLNMCNGHPCHGQFPYSFDCVVVRVVPDIRHTGYWLSQISGSDPVPEYNQLDIWSNSHKNVAR